MENLGFLCKKLTIFSFSVQKMYLQKVSLLKAALVHHSKGQRSENWGKITPSLHHAQPSTWAPLRKNLLV